MKAITFLLSAILFGTTPGIAQDGSIRTVIVQSEEVESNRDLVELTRAEYEEGEFDAFLGDMDQEYQKGVENEQIAGLIAFLKQTGKYSQAEKDPSVAALEEERNRQLLALVEKREGGVLVERVRSSATPFKAEVAEAFETIAKMQMKEPGSSSNPDENRVNDICVEFLFKRYHLAAQNFDAEEPRLKKQKQIALEMECFKRLGEAAKTFQDEALKQKIFLACEHVDAYLMKNRDTLDLATLYLGIREPKTDLEKQIVVIFETIHDAPETE